MNLFFRKTRMNDNEFLYENTSEIKPNSNIKNNKQNVQNTNSNKIISNSVSFSTDNARGFNFVANGYSTRSSSTKRTTKNSLNENQLIESVSVKNVLNKSFIEDDNHFSSQDHVFYDLNDQNNQMQQNVNDGSVVFNQTSSSTDESKANLSVNKTNIDYDDDNCNQEENKFMRTGRIVMIIYFKWRF